MTIRALLTAMLLLSWATNSHAIPPMYTLQTGVGVDDIGGDGEAFVYLTGGALFSRGLSKKSILDLQGELSTYSFPDNSDRSGEELFLQSTFSYTPTAGFRALTYSLGLRHVEEFLSDSDLDASTTSLIGSISVRLDDRSNLRGGVKFDDRDSSDSSETTSYFVNYDYRLKPRIILYTTLSLGSEEISSGGGGAVAGMGNAVARPFVGGHHLPSEGGAGAGGGGGSDVVTSSDNTYLTVGATWALSSANSLDMSVSHREYDTDSLRVFGNIYSLDFFHRF